MLRRLAAARATKKPSRAYALCGFFLRHILRLLVFASQSPYTQPQNVIYSRNVTRKFFTPHYWSHRAIHGTGILLQNKIKNNKKNKVFILVKSIFYRHSLQLKYIMD
jgi:hypothetical protein